MPIVVEIEARHGFAWRKQYRFMQANLIEIQERVKGVLVN